MERVPVTIFETKGKLGSGHFPSTAFGADETVLERRWAFVNSRRPASDTVALRRGMWFSAVMSGLSHHVIYSKFWRLSGISKVAKSSFLPSSLYGTFLSAINSMAYNGVWGRERVIMQEPPCTLCRELRATLAHLGLSIAFPTFMALLATRHKLSSYYVKITEENFARWALGMVKKSREMLLINFTVQTLYVVGLTYRQEYEWHQINSEPLDQEKFRSND